jgi:AraC-like DNA-binding protein
LADTARRRIATSPLAEAVGGLRLRGAIFLRGEYTEGWAYQSVSGGDIAAMLAPGADRVILFHVVASGRCWVQVDGSERHWAEEGDVIVLPYGDTHRMGGREDAQTVAGVSLLQAPPWSQMPVIRHGQGGDVTSVVCGYLRSDDPLFDPRLRALPPAFVVSPQGPARQFVGASIEYALQQTAQVEVDRFEAPTQLAELLLAEVLRLHLAVLAPAMAAIHAAPARRWTVADLAAESAVSPSLIDERFRELLALAPIRYLTGWRMHLARDLLTSTGLGVGAVARRVGYDAEEAFSRAFKREHGVPPSDWRRHAGAGS